jgi:hypothetical protein
MATFNKFQDFVEQLAKGVHQLHAAGHTLKIYLSNTTPDAAADAVKADLAEISGGNGYTAGGHDTQNDVSETGGTCSVTGVDVTITASGGTVGPFRYVVLYNDTPTSPADPLIGWWDYGSSISLNDGESFTTDFGTSMFTVA